jgi:hypothetical protein
MFYGQFAHEFLPCLFHKFIQVNVSFRSRRRRFSSATFRAAVDWQKAICGRQCPLRSGLYSAPVGRMKRRKTAFVAHKGQGGKRHLMPHAYRLGYWSMLLRTRRNIRSAHERGRRYCQSAHGSERWTQTNLLRANLRRLCR